MAVVMDSGSRLPHRMVTHCGYRGRGLPVLCLLSVNGLLLADGRHIRLLKLFTGVEISTRPVIKSGSPGNAVNSRRRTAAAIPKRTAFLLSTAIVGHGAVDGCYIRDSEVIYAKAIFGT